MADYDEVMKRAEGHYGGKLPQGTTPIPIKKPPKANPATRPPELATRGRANSGKAMEERQREEAALSKQGDASAPPARPLLKIFGGRKI